MTYKEIKEALKKEHINTKYFTPEFYNIYTKAVNDYLYKFIHRINDKYKKDNITLFHSYDEVYASDFYNLNSSGYCRFLEVIASYNLAIKDVKPHITGPVWINDGTSGLCSYYNNAHEIEYDLYNKTIDYITFDGENVLTLEVA